MCAYIYVAEITHTSDTDKRYLSPRMTTYSPTELDEKVVSKYFHS